MARQHITTEINGEPQDFLCDTEETLLDVLRDEFQLTGTKEGCSSGDCGACSVMVDDRLVCSCLVWGVEAQDKKIETIEGMAEGDTLHPLQTKFLEEAALQCGFCTAGILMSATKFLEENARPTKKEVQDMLSGHICRCTGYTQIIRAILQASGQ